MELHKWAGFSTRLPLQSEDGSYFTLGWFHPEKNHYGELNFWTFTVAAPLIAAASNKKIFSGQLPAASIQERPNFFNAFYHLRPLIKNIVPTPVFAASIQERLVIESGY